MDQMEAVLEDESFMMGYAANPVVDELMHEIRSRHSRHSSHSSDAGTSAGGDNDVNLTYECSIVFLFDIRDQKVE